MPESRGYDLVVVGGGSAGLAAATAARAAGVDRVLVIERERSLGGVLRQCVHDGFGLHLCGTSLTGPAYAQQWIVRAHGAGVECAPASMALSLRRGRSDMFEIEAVGAAFKGRTVVQAPAVVIATGCRERTRGAMQIPGTRPAGVYTAGTAQYMVNVANQMPGDKAVILGSGDIGLIMARRLVLEGAEVRLVLGQEATGLVRNHIRCVEDFGIPIRYGWGLISVHGRGQIKGVAVAPLRADGRFDADAREYIRCNTLLIACGLIPERELLDGFGGEILPEGLFVCGNASTPHDLVDQVTQDGLRAGLSAAAFLGRFASVPPDLQAMLDARVEEPKGSLSAAGIPPASGVRRVVCTICPSGCVIEADGRGSLSGNSCSRGAAFAESELKRPRRLYTGTVRARCAAPGAAIGAAGPGGPAAARYTGTGGPCRLGAEHLLPVRTEESIDKDIILKVNYTSRRIIQTLPVVQGEVIMRDVAGSGADLIAACSMDERGVIGGALG